MNAGDGRSRWAREMRERAREMRAAAAIEGGAALKRARRFANDLDLFESAMAALLNSDLEPDCFEPGAAPAFAALLVRIAEQTAAEFGHRAAAEAFRAIGEDMEEMKP